MKFGRKPGIFLCVLSISLLFLGTCHAGGILGTVNKVVDGVLTGLGKGVDKVLNLTKSSGGNGVGNVVSPILTGLGGIVNNVTSIVCKVLYFQFKEIDSNPSVVVESGTIVGRYVKIEGLDVVASFLRIPYAKPPLGELRFKRAQPVDPWDGNLQANKKAPPCMQYSSNGNSSWQSPYPPTEDCLVLNVFVPKRCINLGKLQVLVWIHGGSFAVGSSAIYDGSLLSFYGQSIVVTVNYRLGVFGFLNADPDEAPGNMGMTDQVMAIQWVKDNIAAFGGDPNKITIMGESAGAMSVSLHLVSPLTRNLFHRAIMESGSMYGFLFIDTAEMSQSKANDMAEAAGCLDDPNGIVECMRGIDALTLAKAENTLRPHFGLFSQPSIDNSFLTQHPIASYDSGDIANVDILAGSLKDEASLFLNLGLPDVFSFTSEPQLNLTYAKSLLPTIFELLPQDMHKQISKFYLKNIQENDSATIVEALKSALGDLAFFCPVHFLSEKLNNAYEYWWTYLSSMSPNSKWVGSFHGVDVPYVFGFPLVAPDQYTLGDIAFSAYIMRQFLSFASNGYPLERYNLLPKTRWSKFSDSSDKNFEIRGVINENIPFPRKKGCEFWRPIFADYANYVDPLNT